MDTKRHRSLCVHGSRISALILENIDYEGDILMNTASVTTLYRYHLWAQALVWECIMTLTDAQFVQPVAYSIGSIRNQVVHQTSVDRRWFARLRGLDTPAHLAADTFETCASIRQVWDADGREHLAWLENLAEDVLQDRVHIALPHRGISVQQPLWQLVTHVVNHGTDHRAQILVALHGMGAPTVEQDMMFYLWSHGEEM